MKDSNSIQINFADVNLKKIPEDFRVSIIDKIHLKDPWCKMFPGFLSLISDITAIKRTWKENIWETQAFIFDIWDIANTFSLLKDCLCVYVSMMFKMTCKSRTQRKPLEAGEMLISKRILKNTASLSDI